MDDRAQLPPGRSAPSTGPRRLDPDAGHPRHRDHPDLLRLDRGACDLRSREVLTALVVDPSLASRRRIGTLLRLGGWHVLEATSSRQPSAPPPAASWTSSSPR